VHRPIIIPLTEVGEYIRTMNATYKSDYYEILGVTANASQQEIREAYRQLAFRYHPDRNDNDPGATEKMKAINEAYATLSNPTKRNEYDAFRIRFGSTASDEFRKTYSHEDIFRNSDIDQIFEEFSRSFGFRNSDEIFKQFYGNRSGFVYRTYVYYGGQQGSEPNEIQSVPAHGCSVKMLKYFLEKVLRIQVPEKGKDFYDVLRFSPEKAKSGGEIKYNYRKWGTPKNLMIKIPPGIQNGQTIKLKGMGSPGKAGGIPGDLFLKVKIIIPCSQRIKAFFKL
jgi:curved DNA-binding protein CbpA